jgi:hypothetical protein
MNKAGYVHPPCPSQAVINVVREAVNSAHGCLLLRGVTAGTIVLCHIGDYHLGVTLGAQGTTLQQGLAKVNTSWVHVQAGIHIVEGIYYHVQFLLHRKWLSKVVVDTIILRLWLDMRQTELCTCIGQRYRFKHSLHIHKLVKNTLIF